MTDDSSLSLIFFVQPPAAKSLPQGASAELGLCQSQACWDFCPRFFLSTLSPYFCQIKLNMVFVQNLYTKYLWPSSIASFTSPLNLLDLGGTNRVNTVGQVLFSVTIISSTLTLLTLVEKAQNEQFIFISVINVKAIKILFISMFHNAIKSTYNIIISLWRNWVPEVCLWSHRLSDLSCKF